MDGKGDVFGLAANTAAQLNDCFIFEIQAGIAPPPYWPNSTPMAARELFPGL